MTNEQAPLRRLLRKADTKKMFGNPPESTFYKMINDGVIPLPARANPGRYSPGLWFEDECLAAQERLRKERDEQIAERERQRDASDGAPVEPKPSPSPKAAHKPACKAARVKLVETKHNAEVA
jgi:hypothetical protein